MTPLDTPVESNGVAEDAPLLLVAEDSPVQATLIARTLIAAGYRVLVADNGRRALAHALERQPALLLTDVVMPELDGLALCRTLRERAETRGLPILLLTSLSSPADVLEGLAVGADDYLVKPYREERLLAKVTALLQAQPEAPCTAVAPVELSLDGRLLRIPVRPRTTLRLLTSTYDHALEQNRELRATREEVRRANRDLERKVDARTAELSAANTRLEEALRELYETEEALIQSEKLTAVGQMVGGIVHEINNPVMGAINYVQYAIEQSTDPELTAILGRAEASISRVMELVDSMLHFVRRKDVGEEAVDLKQAIDETLTLMAPELKTHSVEVQLGLATDLPPVAASRVGLEQVCANLIKNAIDAMGDSDAKRIVLTATAHADRVELTVEDNGPGVPEALRAQVFEAFFTTKPRDKGTGLGLAICRRILRAHGGDLDYRAGTAAGEGPGGARFVATLRPASAGAPAADRP